MLFVVIVNSLDRLDAWIIIAFVVLPRRLLVPVKDLVWTVSLRYMTEREERDYALGRQMARSTSHQLPRTQQPGQSRREG